MNYYNSYPSDNTTAKRLLKGTDMKVYEIAEAVGYTDPKYFARVFKDELGVSPGDYRQQ